MSATVDLAAELAAFGVATCYEAAGRRGLLDLPLTCLHPGTAVAGPARIAACGQGDNRAVHEVMSHVQPGDVLVLRMPRPEPVALLGELLATQAEQRGAAAVLVDAAVRDVGPLGRVGLPVWTRFVSVRGATKAQRGAVDVPVAVGGCIVSPGDWIVLDADGGWTTPAPDIPELIEKARARVEREAGLLERYRAGELSYDLYGMRAEDVG
ncbi:dimethylmenaquinone methyltransferase [Acidimicrobiaceae bacterium USS-CC1]|uniref:Putative 4-hydroxy-4-methyl-2-oxoglutarate aldolase n=1 Tax=Acidiferrimicrobium australe TaxID=2664430 RepID=A0ABW9QPJ3_9ACTN|nr:dimethylmenaquinone methyltransferase [Acidiferrimicrobium australe]